MRETRRWVNQGQPQTLQIAVFLLYINAAFGAFDMLSYRVFPWFLLVPAIGGVLAGRGIANERKWAYFVAIAVSFMPFALRLYYGGGLLGASMLNLLFEVALVALLLHPQSRDYERIWFK
ncbi:MAG: hypothetical protein H0W70_06600 [Actinobacteria bacterium]|nr:hypothetical protein [Actinomycetota bacterium]